ncbi:hypothetical protein ACUXG4_003142 [Cupriavidus metallidurans]|jgi:hypothetical protein
MIPSFEPACGISQTGVGKSGFLPTSSLMTESSVGARFPALMVYRSPAKVRRTMT